jgi:hypothetical protein
MKVFEKTRNLSVHPWSKNHIPNGNLSELKHNLIMQNVALVSLTSTETRLHM